MSNFNQYANVENIISILVGGEDFAFYANLDDLETSANFANWHLDLVNSDFQTVVQDVGTLTKDIISGSDYRFYSEFTIPEGLTAGCYYLVVIDETYAQVKYLSNKLYYSTITDYSIRYRYRNSKNILNFNYSGLSEYYNKGRIKLKKRQPNQDVTSIGYEQINGSFNPVRYVKGKTYEFITLWYDEYDHDAFNALTIHNLIEIVEEGSFVQYVRGEDSYSIDWNDNYPLAEGNIRLQRKNSYSSNKTL